MNIRQPKTVKARAAAQLERAEEKQRIMLVFCGIVAALCALVTLAGFALDHKMSQSGGLGQLGTRSLLSTVQVILPFAHTLVLMGLELGLLNAMLRISRGQYASPQSLRMGLARFWPMLWCVILRAAIYIGISLAAAYVAITIFTITPLSRASLAILEPMLAAEPDPLAVVERITADGALTAAFLKSVLPMYILLGVLVLAAVIPVSYRLRCANYVLVDDPTAGALRALIRSAGMTRRNAMAFFKLDLSFWWYHLLGVLAMALSYGDLLLPMLGISLPWSGTAATLIFYGVYLVIQCAIYYFFRPRVEVSTALIYDAIRPREENRGQVLGNIFQM